MAGERLSGDISRRGSDESLAVSLIAEGGMRPLMSIYHEKF